MSISLFFSLSTQAPELAAALGRAEAPEDVGAHLPLHLLAHRGGDDRRSRVLQAGVAEPALLVPRGARRLPARQQGAPGPGGDQRRAGHAARLLARVPGQPPGAALVTLQHGHKSTADSAPGTPDNEETDV